MQLDKRLPNVLAELIDTRRVAPIRIVYAGEHDVVISTTSRTQQHVSGIQRVNKVGRHCRGLFAWRDLRDGVWIRYVHSLKSGHHLNVHVRISFEHCEQIRTTSRTCFLAVFR